MKFSTAFEDADFAKKYSEQTSEGAYDPSIRNQAMLDFSGLKDSVDKPKIILDVGCGNGKNSLKNIEYLKPDIFIGFDKSESAIQFANDYFKENNVSIPYALSFGDAHESEKTIDNLLNEFGVSNVTGAISFEVVHWLTDHTGFLLGLKKCLGEKGSYTFTLSTSRKDFADDDKVIPFINTDLWKVYQENIISGIKKIQPDFSGAEIFKEVLGPITDAYLEKVFTDAGYVLEKKTQINWNVTVELDTRLDLAGRILCFQDSQLAEFPSAEKDRIVLEAAEAAKKHEQYEEFKKEGKGIYEKHAIYKIRPK